MAKVKTRPELQKEGGGGGGGAWDAADNNEAEFNEVGAL
jgi:hypothetical protein